MATTKKPYAPNTTMGAFTKVARGVVNSIAPNINMNKQTKAKFDSAVKALSGDTGAQNLVYNIQHAKSPTVASLFTSKKASTDVKPVNSSKKTATTVTSTNKSTKKEDVATYNTLNDKVLSGAPMSAKELKRYRAYAKKWNLKDMTDTFNRQQYDLEKQKKAALRAEDISLNNSLSAINANNFQNMLGTQQELSNRGLVNSGIASDAYMRAGMASNKDYQNAYANTTANKTNINASFGDKIAQSMQAQQQNKVQVEAQAQLNKQAESEVQAAQDKYLTEQTGFVYLNGKPVLDKKKKPIPTMAWLKMKETERNNLAKNNLTAAQIAEQARHNKVSENQTAQKNANSHAVAMTNASNAAQKLAATLAMKTEDLKFKYAKLTSDAKAVQQKIDIAVQSNLNTADKNTLTSYSTAIKGLNAQIAKYQKDEEPVPQPLLNELARLTSAVATFKPTTDTTKEKNKKKKKKKENNPAPYVIPSGQTMKY